MAIIDFGSLDLGNILNHINETEVPKAVAKATAPKPKAKANVPRATAKETKPKLSDRLEQMKEDNVVHSLSHLPAMDGNYTGVLNKATKEQLEKAIEIMEKSGGEHKTRIKRCRDKLKSLEKGKTKVEPKKYKTTEQSVEEPKKKALIIQFPTKKPEIETLEPTNEGHTYEECEAKLNKEREIFKDADSKFVIDGLLAKCKEDANFRDNVMREDKTYAGSFEYFFDLARQGFAIKVNNNAAYLDNEMALEYAINYFNKK